MPAKRRYRLTDKEKIWYNKTEGDETLSVLSINFNVGET